MRNPLSLEAFADWCEKKPADEEYEYGDVCNCAFHQYLSAVGLPVWIVSNTSWVDHDCRFHDLPKGANEAVVSHPRTFGALANRLRLSTRRDGPVLREGVSHV